MQCMIDGLQVSGTLNFCLIAEAEDATDMSSESATLLGEISGGLDGVLGDKSVRLLEVLGDNSDRLSDSVDLAEVIGVLGVEPVPPFT